MDTKLKYVRLEQYDEIIIFPEIIQHSEFRNWNPISGGFCYIGKDKIECFGRSISLGLESKPNDSFYATKQAFGWEACEVLDFDKNEGK